MATLKNFCKIGINMPDADFWLIRIHNKGKVGEPVKTFSPEYIGLKVTEEGKQRILPGFLFHWMKYLQSLGYWQARSHGTTFRQNIKITDVKDIQIGF